MTINSETPQWGSFALVSYIPDPLGSFLHSLRQILPGEDNPQAHITILPPRPLQVPVDAASLEAKKTLSHFSRFEVELAEVRSFSESQVLYLDISKGGDILHQLHDALNVGTLEHDENFEFRPHLTLGGPVEKQREEQTRGEAERLWRARDCSARFRVEEIVFLWLPAQGSWKDWDRLWAHRLPGGEAGKAASAGPIQTY
jgi:2'-5' RNA ligase